MTDYKAQRSGQPQRPADIGTVDGHIVGVWHNWDHLTVKRMDGAALLTWESDGTSLIHQARLVNQRYLGLVLGSGFNAFDVKVYDFAQKSWRKEQSLGAGTVEHALLSVHPASSLIFLNTSPDHVEHAEVWNLDQPDTRRPIADDMEFDCADFIDAASLIACNFEGIFRISQDGDCQMLRRADDIALMRQRADITAVKWLPSSRAILAGDAGGVLFMPATDGGEGKILGRFSSEIHRIDYFGGNLIAVSTLDHCVHLLNIDSLAQKTLTDAFGLHISPGKLIMLNASRTSFTDMAFWPG